MKTAMRFLPWAALLSASCMSFNAGLLIPMTRHHESSQPRALAASAMTAPGAVPPPVDAPPEPGHNAEAYDRIDDNNFHAVARHPLSTFSIDVDTASYSNVRRFLNEGKLPPRDAVRVEELINYFPYSYRPSNGDTPFATHVGVADCPWNAEHRLVRIGLKGREVPLENRPPCNLVFLIDVSGSMGDVNKLPLVKDGLKLLIEELRPRDRVAMVTYAGRSGLVLPSTPGEQKARILSALEKLESGGSTNGGEGIELAYKVAQQHMIKGGSNRVVLCTDGDFNVGVTDQGSLTRLIEDKARGGVFLTVLGFGMGNLKDATMEKLADRGNGNYAYIDNINEARKVLVEQMAGTLLTIAKDVKIQVEFNPAKAAAYRLIGYENRVLAAQDFNDDTKDAGEIGSGHSVTALYEVVPAGKAVPGGTVDALKYQAAARQSAAAATGELLTVKLRYKEPDGDMSKLVVMPVTDAGQKFDQANDDFRFAAAVAAFGMLLRDSPHKGGATFELVQELARGARGNDPQGHRGDFLKLVDTAQSLKR
jgi:Ca-activated chloride channel family protein